MTFLLRLYSGKGCNYFFFEIRSDLGGFVLKNLRFQCFLSESEHSFYSIKRKSYIIPE